MTASAGPTSARPPRLVLFPGLGADERLFAEQREAFPDLDVPPWLDPEPRESLSSYGRRMAARVAYGPEPLYVGGASFGGAVAMEVARHVPARAVFLIGSCRTPRAIPPLFRLLGHVPLPAAAFALLVRAAPVGVSLFGARAAEQRQALLEQLRLTPPSFLSWGIRALLDWDPPTNLPVPVHHIHGGNDRLLPCQLGTPDVVVPGAGHLVNLTNPAEVNRFILERMRE